MKNMFADIRARRQRMADRSKKVVEATAATKAALKEMHSSLDEMEVTTGRIKSDCVEIKAMVKELCTDVNELTDGTSAQAIKARVHGLDEVTP